MAFIKKVISFFDFTDDFSNDYLILDYKILGGSLISTALPLLYRYGLECSKKSYFGASSTLINEIINNAKENPFQYFKDLKPGSFPVIRAKIEDSTQALRNSWIESYLNGSSDTSKILDQAIQVTNPLNSSESINVVFSNLRVFNNEISGFQLLASNEWNPIVHYLSHIDTKDAFTNVTASSKQFFNLSDVFISGIKVNTKKNGDHLLVTHVFNKVRDSLTDVEKKGINKVQKILLWTSAAASLFALIMVIRILIKKRKLRKQQQSYYN